MAQAKVISKALRVRRILKKLARAKENTIREMVGLPPLVPWTQQICDSISSCFRETCCRAFCPCCVEIPTFRECCCPKGSCGYSLCTPGEYYNDIIKSFLGFFFGLLLSMGLYLFFCLQMKVNMEFALTVGIISGLCLSIGMAFFSAVRCMVFLTLPNFCSSKGRTFLMMYAMVLVMNYPVQNYSHNMTVLTDAATCGQSMALNETKKLVQAAASPLLSIISGIKTMLESIKKFADMLRKAFKALVRAMQEIVSIIGKAFKWLASMTDVCNDNMGEPYRKCKKVFEDGYKKCSDALGIFDFICNIVTLVGKVCYIARIGELLCAIAGAIKDLILDKVGPPIMNRINDVKDMFYFNVSVNYHYHYNMNQSKPYSEVRKAILHEIREKLTIIDVIQAIIDNAMSMTILLVVFKAVMYRRGYLHKDGYDNLYITRQIFEVDNRRIDMGKETIFPLKAMEKFKYIKSFSYKVTKSEAKKIIKGLTFWCFAAFHAGYYIFCDYGLYWILDLIRRHMDIQTSAAIPPHLKMHVKGKGPMPEMYKSMVGVVEPVADEGLGIDTTVCLPNPGIPNFVVYKIVATIMGICLFLTLFEAYGLRLRHIVAACYYPWREKIRAVWLYNHIMLRRGGFLLFARRQLQLKRENAKAIDTLSVVSSLVARFPLCKALMKLLGRHRKYCLSCGQEGKAEDMENYVHCDNCKSPYCNDCFIALENVCTACMNPMDYGDQEGMSVETDSSEDEEDKAIRVKRLKDRKQKVKKKQQDKDPKKIVKAFQTKFAPQSAPDSKMALLDNEDGDKQSPTSWSQSESDESGSEIESSEEESTSEYDTDYQYRSSASTPGQSEDEKSHRKSVTKKKSDVVTMDIFQRKETRL